MQKEVYEFIIVQANDPIIEWRTCVRSGVLFPILQSEVDFLRQYSPVFNGEKKHIPLPTLSREERQKQKMSYINQLHLFRRPCDATGKNIITKYLPTSPYKVYDQAYFWSDERDQYEYARDIDLSRGFFEQFHELDLDVPHPSLFKDFKRDINSDFTNYAAQNKNCYLIFDSDENEEVLYSYGINGSKRCGDCYRCTGLEYCYEMIDAHGCYNSAFLQNCDDCRGCYFGFQLTNCDHCIMCSNLVNQSYHYKNKPISKEEYEKIILTLQHYNILEEAKKTFADFIFTELRPAAIQYRTQKVIGNLVVDSKDVTIGFDSMNVETGRYLTQIFVGAKNVYDVDEVGQCEIAYCSNNSGFNAYRLFFCYQCLNEVSDLYYCKDMFFSKYCFGCSSMKHAQYCIFNKQYTKEEYEKTVVQLIDHMKTTGERGQYFPLSHSPFPYNLTMANEHHSISRDEALAQGNTWYDDVYGIDLPEHADVIVLKDESMPDFNEISNKIILCSISQRPYRITKVEYTLHERLGLPLPRKHFLTRHEERFKKRPRRELYLRTCDKTGEQILSVYPQDVPFKVYSEEAYRQEVYG